MADFDAGASLDQYHAAIEAEIKAQFPTLQVVEFDREDKRPFRTPAMLLEVTEFEPAEDGADAGTGQLCVDVTVEARVILGFKLPEGKREAKRFAMAFAAWIHLRRWKGFPNGECRFVGAYEDTFSPGLDQYVVWRVGFQQKLFLGETVWTPGTRPTSIWLRMSVDGVQDGELIPVADE